jgi:hypothetical protein
MRKAMMFATSLQLMDHLHDREKNFRAFGKQAFKRSSDLLALRKLRLRCCSPQEAEIYLQSAGGLIPSLSFVSTALPF